MKIKLIKRIPERVKQAFPNLDPPHFVPLSDLLTDPELSRTIVPRVLVKLVKYLVDLHGRNKVSGLIALPNLSVELTDDRELKDFKLDDTCAPKNAPEMVADEDKTAATDMYALGVLLRQCTLLKNSKFTLPAVLQTLQTGALRKDPKTRPTAALARRFVFSAYDLKRKQHCM